MGKQLSIPRDPDDFKAFIRDLGDALAVVYGVEMSVNGQHFTVEGDSFIVYALDKRGLPLASPVVTLRTRNPGKTLLDKMPIDIKRDPRLVRKLKIVYMTTPLVGKSKLNRQIVGKLEANKPLKLVNFVGMYGGAGLPGVPKWSPHYRGEVFQDIVLTTEVR